MSKIRVREVADLPLLYDRRPPSNYGVTGIPVHPFINTEFAVEVELAMRQVVLALQGAGLGTARAILFGGIGRSGTGKSLHHTNRAFDLDGLMFTDAENWVADTFPVQPLIYLGIEAVLRQHFGTVLTYMYNSDHQDHFHFDNGERVGFVRHSKSRVLFLQNALSHVFDTPVGIDGVYGPATADAERRIRRELGIGGFSKLGNWVAFLSAVEELALNRQAQIRNLELVA